MTQSIFGPTRLETLARIRKEQQERDAQAATMTPQGAIFSLAYGSGAGLGGGIGGAFGLEQQKDPRLAAIEARDKAMQGIEAEPNTPEYFDKLSEELYKQGQYDYALKLREQATSMRKDQAGAYKTRKYSHEGGMVEDQESFDGGKTWNPVGAKYGRHKDSGPTLAGRKLSLAGKISRGEATEEEIKEWNMLRQKGLEFEYDSTTGSFKVKSGGEDLTIGTQGQVEKDLITGENLLMEAMDLRDRITFYDVGVAGVLGEQLFDRFLGQVIPGIVSKDRVKNRNSMRALREKALRTMTTDNKFNLADREAIERLFPSDGFIESQEAAKWKLESFYDIVSDRMAYNAGKLGRKPLHEMTPQEIGKAASENKLTKSQALRALRVYHGFE